MATLLDLVHLPAEEQRARGLLHTPREIAQQPTTWQGTFDLFSHEQARIRTFLEDAGVHAAIQDRPTVMLIGAGTSDYIGHALMLLLRQQWGCEVLASASTDLLSNLDDYIVEGRRYLWISFSRSGDSPEGVAVLEQAIEKYPLISHLVVTCNPEARMIPICTRNDRGCVIVLDDAVNDRSLAMTSSFTNMVVLGHCLAHIWSLETYQPILHQLRTAAESFLISSFEVAQNVAARRYPRICLVGAGPLAAIARESALKVLEMSAGRTKTTAETTLGLRHGPMAALDRETLFLCFVSGDPSRQSYAADLLHEIGEKQITAARIAVAPASAQTVLAPLCDIFLPIPASVADPYRAVLDVLFGQLLGLCGSIEHGLKPDAPSPGGVINRVVQEFAIYP